MDGECGQERSEIGGFRLQDLALYAVIVILQNIGVASKQHASGLYNTQG
jgi:hypothetical protein